MGFCSVFKYIGNFMIFMCLNRFTFFIVLPSFSIALFIAFSYSEVR